MDWNLAINIGKCISAKGQPRSKQGRVSFWGDLETHL